ncbi:hypothetical protein ElyMa_006931000 [Elysia marginata]|uniref:Uncharacterized protein n=1 Tax=Elysia marginata TaxID=1093978 RepID=A0AAV4JFS4_9GAST|nr:hypothetical protein ElyMa_006931000 [Elysia marginata]
MNLDGNSSAAVAAAPTFPQKQLNGGILTSLPDKPNMEKIGSLQENPFFTKFGLKPASVTRHRYVSDLQPPRGHRLSSNGSVDEDDQPEYRPGSGFVNKLRDKWSHLNTREEKVLKKASSLEDLQPVEKEVGPTKALTPRASNHSLVDKKQPNVLHPAKLAYRAQSIESLSQAHSKHTNHQHPGHRHQQPLFVHPLRHVDPAWMKDKPTVTALKSPRGTHVEAPDVDLARDDIVIIEKTHQPEPEDKAASDSGTESDETSPPLSYREEMLPNELPKPNTVQTVRNIFETNSSLPSWKNSLVLKRRTSDSPPVSLPLSPVCGSLTSHTLTSPQVSSPSGVSIPGFSPVTSPRLLSSDSHAKPILSPPAIDAPRVSWNQVEHPKPRADSQSSYSQPSRIGNGFTPGTTPAREKVSPLSTAASSTSAAKPYYSVSSSSTSVEEKPASVLERSNFFESPRLGETRPSPSPRNTASVKPTISSKPSSPVKPLPLSTPASAATSYKRSSPVVPVAPYKDKTDDSKEDGVPVMIFSKSKISPKREKTPRINDYVPVTEAPKGLPVDNLKKHKDDVIINNNFQGKLYSKETTIDLKQNKFTTGRDRVVEKKSSPVETDKIIQTPQQTTIQIGLKKADVSDMKVDKSISADRAVGQVPMLAAKRKQAPSVPVVDKVKSQMAPQPPVKEKDQSQSMLYISSSESGESDSSTPPETPRTQDDKKMTQNSIKDVPSLITVSRLKQDREPAPPRFSTPSEEKGSNLSSTVAPSMPSKFWDNKEVSSDTATSGKRPLALPKAADKEPVSKENSTKSISKPADNSKMPSEEPIKGVPTIIANRLRQAKADPSQMARNVLHQPANNFLRLDGNLNDESSTDSDASPRPPVSKPVSSSSSSSSPFAVNLASVSSSSTSSSDSPRSELNEIEAALRKMGSAKKQPTVVQIFDSKQLAEKRKNKAAARTAAQQAGVQVPGLDLSGLDEDRSKVYRPPQKKVGPCNIKFIGENVKTGRSLLAKKRLKKVSIQHTCIIKEYECSSPGKSFHQPCGML